jgi:hypothetical protein
MEAAFVAPTLKGRFQEGLDGRLRFFYGDETAWQAEYISVVVGTGQSGDFPIPGQGCP